tara:strand:- start:1043 stop:1426 length:384 start_codon:yes stop_codon:yes gene_type:complete
MGLRSDIQTAVAEAFTSSLSDVVVSFTLVKTTDGAYNVTNDNRTPVEVKYISKGVFSSFTASKIDGINIKSEDESVVVNAVDLSVAPELDDVVLLSSGTEYIVINCIPVMGGGSIPIIYSMQVRKSI